MRYVLAVLSHGQPASDTAEACLNSFIRHVTPQPILVSYRHDGPGRAYLGVGQQQGAALQAVSTAQKQLGFCESTRLLWRSATETAKIVGATHVFWLEHDFLFTEDIDLTALAFALSSRSHLAQMALMRDAVNPRERALGGLYEFRRDGYQQRLTRRDDGTLEWHEHSMYFTTNPSLMTVEFMQENPWPGFGSECEGRFGIELVRHGYTFGVWGDGHPSVRHIGERTGKGY